MTAARPVVRPATGLPLSAALSGRREVLDRLLRGFHRAAGARLPVLIEGERGTGKVRLARALHAASSLRAGPLLVVDGRRLAARCAGDDGGAGDALARAVHDARAGTLVVREVGALLPHEQQVLLDALRADAAPRLVATTALDLGRAVVSGWFAAPLRDRLTVLRLRLPALRETPGAVPGLARTLLARAARRLGAERARPGERVVAEGGAVSVLTDEAALTLASRPWTGNVRELACALRLLAGWAAGGAVTLAHVDRLLAQGHALLAPGWSGRPPRATRAARGSDEPTPAGATTLADAERALIEERLKAHAWHQVRTAASLGIDRKTLYRKIREYGLGR